MNTVASFHIEYVQYLDAQGRLTGSDLPAFAGNLKTLVDLYQRMAYVRVFDTKAIALQRTGKLGTYASSLGHEAAHVGIGAAMLPEDVFFPMYREYGVLFYRGLKARKVLLYWGGDERGSQFDAPMHDLPWCVPIATQCLHAAGAALAFKLRKEPRVAVSVVGDGGSSKADFYSAINAAGAYVMPYVSVIVNNQWAISVPRSAQTGAATLAQKGIAGGLACIQADGDDIIAVVSVMQTAIERARSGKGGSVVELVTYRLSDHTTADDARRYRSEDEVKSAWLRDPLLRLRRYLESENAWSDQREAEWKAECGQNVDIEVNAYLELQAQPVTSMFDFVYADLSHDLREQRAQAAAT